MKKLFSIALLGLLFLSAGNAFAYNYKINQRQCHQESRIQQGIRSGQLTPWESNRLVAQEHRINYLENRYRADGNLSRAERERLQKLLNQTNRHIYNQKHDNQYRF